MPNLLPLSSGEQMMTNYHQPPYATAQSRHPSTMHSPGHRQSLPQQNSHYSVPRFIDHNDEAAQSYMCGIPYQDTPSDNHSTQRMELNSPALIQPYFPQAPAVTPIYPYSPSHHLLVSPPSPMSQSIITNQTNSPNCIVPQGTAQNPMMMMNGNTSLNSPNGNTMRKMKQKNSSGNIGKRKRAAVACDACHLKKLACEGTQPCRLCRNAGRPCVYSERIRRPRPSRALIEKIQKDNQHSLFSLQQEVEYLKRQNRGLVELLKKEKDGIKEEIPDIADIERKSYYGDASNNSSLNMVSPKCSSPLSSDAKIQSNYAESPNHYEEISNGINKELLEANVSKYLEYESQLTPAHFFGVDPSLAHELLELHWNRQNHTSLLTYRPLIVRDMLNSGPYFSKALLFAIFASASRYSKNIHVRSDPEDASTAGEVFFAMSWKLISESRQSTIPNLVALLLMGSSLVSSGKMSQGFLYTGFAIRMLFDLNLNEDPNYLTEKLAPEEIEYRKRIFWGAYICDRLQSLYVGRPFMIQNADFSVGKDFNDMTDEAQVWKPPIISGTKYSGNYTDLRCHTVSNFISFCKLSEIMSEIIRGFYSVETKAEQQFKLVGSISLSLETWKALLPSNLSFEPWNNPAKLCPPPNILSMNIMYQSMIILLHRPFISDRRLREKVGQHWMTCTEAAMRITDLVKAYNNAFTFRTAPYMLSYATYVASTIHVRNARMSSSSKDALYFCLLALRKLSETNAGIERALFTIYAIMRRLNLPVDQDDLTVDEDLFTLEDLEHNDKTFDTTQIVKSFDLPGNSHSMYESSCDPAKNNDYLIERENLRDFDARFDSLFGWIDIPEDNLF